MALCQLNIELVRESGCPHLLDILGPVKLLSIINQEKMVKNKLIFTALAVL